MNSVRSLCELKLGIKINFCLFCLTRKMRQNLNVKRHMLSTGVSALHFLKITCKSVWVVLQHLPWIFWWCSFCTWYMMYCTFFIKWAIVFLLMLRLLWIKRFQPDLQSDDFYHSQHQCKVYGRQIFITQQHRVSVYYTLVVEQALCRCYQHKHSCTNFSHFSVGSWS